MSRRPRHGGAVVVSRLVAPCSSSPTASSAAPTCRSRRRCSARPRPRCSSSRSPRSPRCGRRRGCSAGRERRLVRVPGRRRRRARRARRRSSCSSPPTPGWPAPRTSATTSRRRWSTSRSGSASRSRRCCSATCGALLSPWRAIGRAAGWLARRVGGDELPPPLAYPARLGRWPAAVGHRRLRHLRAVLGRPRASPAPLAVLVLALRRRDARGDEPLRRGGVDAQRRPVRRLLRPVRVARAARAPRRRAATCARRSSARAGSTARPGTAALLLAGIGVTAFDGASEGPLFNDVLPHLQDFFGGLGLRAGARARAGLRRRPARRGRVRRADLGRSRWPACRASDGAPARGRSSSTRSSRSSPPTSSRTTSRCSPTTARTSWRLASDPLGDGSRPVRRRRRDDRLRRRQRDRHLVRPGRRARARPRRRARARPRPRARRSTAATATPPARRSSCWC